MQLSGTVLRTIEAVLRDAERKPADAVLRERLRAGELNADQKGIISRAVFTYFRWRGWLDARQALRGQLEHAFDLTQLIRSDPKKISDRELLEKALPQWAHQVMPVTPALLREFQSEPRLWLRGRMGKGQELAQKLETAESHPKIPDAVWYRGEEDLFRTAEFHEGQFEIQDLSSQIVGHLCAPAPGETWWDACAGEGGKTLHLCDLMRNKGLVWASDRVEWRLDVLKRRAARAKLFNHRTKAWTNQDQLPMKTKFDGILVDAPCTGIGTWGRNPHARWTAKESDAAGLATLQFDLLHKIAGSVKAGGKLIYSVCTLTSAETDDLADKFQAAHPEFQPLPVRLPQDSLSSARIRLLPQEWQANGMFIALWQRKTETKPACPTI